MEYNDTEKKKKGQLFYFTDEGQLVVESNKGVWVDGTPYVKMYGNFTCNAKTMGIIIQHMKNIPVKIGREEYIRLSTDRHIDEYDEHTIENFCILGVDKSGISEYLEELAVKEYTNSKINEARKEQDNWHGEARKYLDKYHKLSNAVLEHNKLPWYKRMFHKITY